MSAPRTEADDIIARHAEDVAAVGLNDAWQHLVSQEPSGARTVLLGVAGSFATYLREIGFRSTA